METGLHRRQDCSRGARWVGGGAQRTAATPKFDRLRPLVQYFR